MRTQKISLKEKSFSPKNLFKNYKQCYLVKYSRLVSQRRTPQLLPLLVEVVDKETKKPDEHVVAVTDTPAWNLRCSFGSQSPFLNYKIANKKFEKQNKT